MNEITAQDQMNISEKLTVEYGMDQDFNLELSVKNELEKRSIVHDQDLIDELSKDIKYLHEREMHILEN